MSLFNNEIRMGAAGAGGTYEIERSLRFNKEDDSKLSRSWSGDDANLKTQTYSFWFKRKITGTQMFFLSCWNGSNTDRIGITADGQFFVEFKDGGSTEAEWHSDRVLYDEGTWYHAVVAIDTTQSTETDRFKVWLNNEQITHWDTYNAVDQNYELDGLGRANKTHVMGAYAGGTTSTNSHWDGYITEFHYLDGIVGTPADFGETNPATGQWVPIKYTGSYGAKGWYVNFSDNSDTTDATLGKDSSGNGNNWTPANLSVSAGIGNDSFIDTPTNNFMNLMSDGRLNCTITEGGMKMVTTGSNVTSYSNFQIPTSGKWYFEVKMTTSSSTMFAFDYKPRINVAHNLPGDDSDFVVYPYAGTYEIYYGGSSVQSGSFGHGAGTVYQIWFDRDNHTFKVVRDDNAESFTWNIPTALQAYPLSVGRCHTTTWGSGTWEWYFGGNGFNYDIPDGYATLSTANLPEPTIKDPSKHYNTVTYTGTATGSDTQTISGVGFAPDLTWIKQRNSSYSHMLLDTVRGAGKYLESNSSNVEDDDNANGNLTSFTSDGFVTTRGSSNGGRVNENSSTYVSWNWKASDSAAAANTDGTIDSTVSVNTTAGFSIGTYAGTTSAGTIGHGLGAVPKFILIKNLDSGNSWAVYHDSIGADQQLLLNANNATSSDSNGFNEVPTSTVINVGSGAQMDTNQSGDHVFYAFSEVQGYSRFGSYTGNNDSDGHFIYTGFRPALLWIRRTDSGDNWAVYDEKRSDSGLDEKSGNRIDKHLRPDSGQAEVDQSATALSFHSNGVKFHGSNGQVNGTGTYIYAAWAAAPFKYANAR